MTEALEQWRPALRMFMRRTVITATLTLAAFAVVFLFVGGARIEILFLPLVLTVYFAFDDLTKWRIARRDRWTLTPTALLHSGYEGDAQIPLAEIEDTNTRLGWSVIVKLNSGQRVEMPYLRNPRAVAAKILDVRNGMTS